MLASRLSLLHALVRVSALFVAFIAEAAPGHAADKTSLRVEPASARLPGNLARLQLAVSSTAADGRPLDMTREVAYESSDANVLAVDSTGFVTPRGSGTATIYVRAGDGHESVSVTVDDFAVQRAVSFREDVIPILSKTGCNQGACHGAQYGQGGFKLSLFGFAPEDDHPQFVRDWMQRRVSSIAPEQSLVLRKATMACSHEGGRRFGFESDEYAVLFSWIAAGAPGPIKDEPQIADLIVSPESRLYHLGENQQLRVVARYSDGSERDVTHRARFDSLGDGVAQVSGTGYVSTAGRGQAAIMVRYQGQAKVSHVLVPYTDRVDLAGFEPVNFIDEKVREHWQRLGLQPSALCSDAEYIRRASLDCIGTLPEPERVARFVASTDPRKREALVDELLGLTGDPQRDRFVNEWCAFWAMKWGDLIRNNRKSLGEGGMWALYNWTRESLRTGKPVDHFVRELLTAQGSIYENGPANYYKIARNPTDLAETTAQVFLGVRLQCARCHQHPFEVYSQDDFYGLAAFFTRVGTKASSDFGPLGADTIVKLNSSGSIRHPRTNATMQPTPLLEKPVDPAAGGDLRRYLADWLTAPDNRLFSRNIVNRIWGYYMGTALVEPIDDMRATNPPSNPELLDALADDFVAQGFDLRRLMRAIMVSRVYQLSSTPRPENVAETRFYTHYNVKRLPAEVLLDAIDFACGTREKFAGVPAGTRAIELPDPNYLSYFLDTMGRPQRAVACECERTADPNLAQVLQIANGEPINRKLGDKAGRIARMLSEKSEVSNAILEELYAVTLCRAPDESELARCREIIGRAGTLREGLEDVLWALCNSREFLFNH